MKPPRIIATGLSLLLTLSGSLRPQPAQAGSTAAESSFSHVYVNPAPAPIGSFESSGRIEINGRAVENRGALWDGELLHAPVGSTARVSLDGIGHVTLKGGTMVKLAASALSPDAGDRRLLTASIASGEIEVKLQPEANACLMAGGAAFAASAGAGFRLTMNGGHPAIYSDGTGAVRSLGSWGVRLPALVNDVTSDAAVNYDSAIPQFVVAVPEISSITSTGAATVTAAESVMKAAPTPEAQRASFLRSLNLTSIGNSGGKGTAKLYADPMGGMIGMVEAPGAMKINGRAARGKETLWDGELIEAPAGAPARVTLGGIGSLTLTPASCVKISTATVKPDALTSRRVLVASVVSGDLLVRLQQDSRAFVQAFGATFAADGSAHFKLGERDGHAVVDVTSGIVESVGRYVIELTQPTLDVLSSIALAREQATPRRYRVNPVGIGWQTVVPLRGSRELKFRVTAGSGRAAAGVPVSFVLNPPDRNENKVAGSFGRGLINTPTYTATTNADGIVSVPFSAGEAAGSVTIVATVRGEPPQRAAVVTSSNGANGFWNAKTAAPVFLTAAAIIGAGVAVAVSREGKVPIKGIGPLTIVP